MALAVRKAGVFTPTPRGVGYSLAPFGLRGGIAACALLLLTACSSAPQRAASIGEAYVGPSELKIRSDIPLESSTVATVRHGDRLVILQQRRGIFLRIRTPSGAEGWTDARQLLSDREMAGLRDLAERARGMPSQGVATVYGDLRVRTEPSSSAPSFLLVKDGEKFDVLAHVVAARTPAPRPPLVPPPPKKAAAQGPKAAKQPKIPPPPPPTPPGPPPNWLELSRTNAGEDAGSAPAARPPADDAGAKPVPSDDWSLIRTGGGQSGWVLTRRLFMAIPDEVAQYAEGRRIVSYFPLGELTDGGEVKREWLWTTIEGAADTRDFDSFRVFVWSLRHHRYETAYIERNFKGHSPVLLQEVELSAGSKSKGKPAATRYPGFSICVEKADGQRFRREYAFMSGLVRFAGEHPCEAPQPLPVPAATSAATAGGQPAAPAPRRSETLAQRLKRTWGAITRRFTRR